MFREFFTQGESVDAGDETQSPEYRERRKELSRIEAERQADSGRQEDRFRLAPEPVRALIEALEDVYGSGGDRSDEAGELKWILQEKFDQAAGENVSYDEEILQRVHSFILDVFPDRADTDLKGALEDVLRTLMNLRARPGEERLRRERQSMTAPEDHDLPHGVLEGNPSDGADEGHFDKAA